MRRLSVTCLLLLCLLPAAASRAAQDDLVLLLDLSASQWERLHGMPKVRVLRESLAALAADWPPRRRIGLVAFGHRRPGDCSDVESLIALTPIDRAAFPTVVGGLSPRGVAPYGAALSQAAELLDNPGRPGSVLLLSDGGDACWQDPCAVAAELRRARPGLTIDVIGIDLHEAAELTRLRCIAAAGGGRYVGVDTAAGLVQALNRVTGLEPNPEPVSASGLVLQVPPQVTAGSDFTVHWQGPGQDGDILELTPLELNPVPGGPAVTPVRAAARGEESVRLRAPSLPGDYRLRYLGGGGRLVAASVELRVVAAAASLDAPAAVRAGSDLTLTWQGPDRPGDRIVLVPAGVDDAAAALVQVAAGAGSPLTLRLPGTAGDYELRYLSGQPGRVLARRPLRLDAAVASLEAPDSAVAGGSIAVAWQGPGGRSDLLTVVPSDSAERARGPYALVRHGSPTRLRLPDQAGDYEIRYLDGQTRRVLARRLIRLQTVSVELQAPNSGVIGASVEVSWQGPGHRGDRIEVGLAGGRGPVSGGFIHADEGMPGRLVLPDRPGDYELRYLSGQQRRVLGRRPIRVEDAGAELEAPARVVAGQGFEVRWRGPAGSRDRIALARPGQTAKKMDDYADTRDGSPARLRAPVQPGPYQLRYLTGQSYRTLASRPLQVDAEEVP